MLSDGHGEPERSIGVSSRWGWGNDRRFRAFHSKTGKGLWVARLDNTVNANPVTYQGKSGKQYVAVVATDSLVVFGLP